MNRILGLLSTHAQSVERSFKILIVDDDGRTRQLLTNLFLQEGYDVVTASNGVEGWRALHKKGPFDLIVSDQHMPRSDGGPEVSGTELLLLTRFEAETARIHFILTSNADHSRGDDVELAEVCEKHSATFLHKKQLPDITRLISNLLKPHA